MSLCSLAEVAPDKARALIAGMTRAGATSAREHKDIPLPDLIEDLCLPGSITGQGLEILRKGNAFEPWRQAADSVFRRHIEDG